MRKMASKKRLTWMCIVGLVVFLFKSSFTLTAYAETFTDRGILAQKALEYMIQWNNETDSTRESYMGAYTCAAFSRYIFYHLYGDTDQIGASGTGAEHNNTVTTRTYTTVAQVASFIRNNAAPGDAVRVTASSTHIVHLLNITPSNIMVICESNIASVSSNRAWFVNQSVETLMKKGAGWTSGNIEVKIIHSNNNHLTSSYFNDSLLGSKAAFTEIKASKWNDTWSDFQIPSEIYGWGGTPYISDSTPPAILNVGISNVDDTGYTVNCNVWENEEIDHITFVTWTPDNGADGFDDRKEFTMIPDFHMTATMMSRSVIA